MDLELRQDALIRDRVARHRPPETPVMTELERHAELELLSDPQLLQRILADYAACAENEAYPRASVRLGSVVSGGWCHCSIQACSNG